MRAAAASAAQVAQRDRPSDARTTRDRGPVPVPGGGRRLSPGRRERPGHLVGRSARPAPRARRGCGRAGAGSGRRTRAVAGVQSSAPRNSRRRPAEIDARRRSCGIAAARRRRKRTLGGVVGERRGPLELPPGLARARPRRSSRSPRTLGQQVVVPQRRLVDQRVDEVQPGPRTLRHPDRHRPVELRRPASAAAGPAPRRAPRSGPSRCPRRCAAWAWHAAIAACSTYGPGGPPISRARSIAVKPRRMSSWSQRPRFCSCSWTGSPDGPVRAAERDAWISISATSPCTSASAGASSASSRPSRSASRQSPGRIRSSPAVAEYPSLKIR